MHIDYYGFREHPFLMTPDPRLFYASSVHAKAYAHLMYGLAQQEGFVVVTGEVGAGKTTLVERLCAELDPNGFAIARIMTTQVSGDDLLRLIADSFGASPEGDKATVLRGVIARLRNAERRHLLIVDEAQGLNPGALEELRMLSNVTDGNRALLQTMLLGQPQLRQVMASPDLDQLRQRVLASYHLNGLSREETHAYVEHRMLAVGWSGFPNWDGEALDLVHRHSAGIPRRINRLCSRVLLGGALEQIAQLTAPLVEATAQELEDDLGGGTPEPASRHSRSGFDTEAALEDVAGRLDALERQAARRERVFSRMMDLFAEGQPPPMTGAPRNAMPRNAMTVDVEDWFQVQNYVGVVDRAAWETLECRVEARTEEILALFAAAGVQATFFTLGWVAERHPALIRRIVGAGHELASHGHGHERVFEVGPARFREDLHRAREVLEDAGGVAVTGYRAPTFSLGPTLTPWAYDILAETGHRYSSSVFPGRHAGGMDAALGPWRPGPVLEVPMTVLRIPGRSLPVAGGGWFRMTPHPVFTAALRRVNAAGRRGVFYFHPWEIDPGQPRIAGMSWIRRRKHFTGLDRMAPRLGRLLGEFAWGRMDDVFAAELDAAPASLPIAA